MLFFHKRGLAGLVLLISLAGSATAGIDVVNNGFESPDLGAGGYGYGPDHPYGLGVPQLPSAPPGWSFSGTTGIAANGSAFGVTGATNGNSDGGTSTSGQAGFVQNGYGTPNTISQDLSGFTPGSYEVTFSLELRGGNNAAVDVTLGGIDLGTYKPLSSGSFNTVTTSAATLSAGSNLLVFTGVNNPNGGDNTVFIDNVRITPEPASLVIWGLAIAGGLLLTRRRRKA